MDTQPPTACDIDGCRNSRTPQALSEEERNEEFTNADHSYLICEDSDSEDEYTPSESSEDELAFATEEEADSWLMKHFSLEEVQDIKAAWTWSISRRNWIHHDKETNTIIEWPKDIA
jgi:hypothetical protein